jgi:hypothetical protein
MSKVFPNSRIVQAAGYLIGMFTYQILRDLAGLSAIFSGFNKGWSSTALIFCSLGIVFVILVLLGWFERLVNVIASRIEAYSGIIKGVAGFVLFLLCAFIILIFNNLPI